MWSFLTSLSFGTSRFLSLVSLALLCVLGTCRAWGDTCGSYTAAANGEVFPSYDPQAAANAAVAHYGSVNGFTGCTATSTAGSYGTNYTYRVDCTGHPNVVSLTSTWVTGACPACPAAGSDTLYGLDTYDGSGSTTCHNGCAYTTPAAALVVKCSATSGACSSTSGVVESQSTGYGCGSTAAYGAGNPPTFDSTNPTSTQCDASGTVCAENSGGQNCGSYNGDLVCVGTIAPGTCVSYASGGVACAASTAPPVPNNGTPGTPATPAVTVSANGETVNYYNSTQVTSSTTTTSTTNPVQSQPTGTQGLGGSGGSSGGSSSTVAVSSVAGTVSVAGSVSVVPNAANGDCGASGVSCTGAGLTGTSWSGDCTDFTACLEGFYTGIQSAPIISGAVAIESSWPAGACDLGSVTLASLGNATLNYSTVACQVWNNYMATPLSAIMLVVYAVAGVFLVLSA